MTKNLYFGELSKELLQEMGTDAFEHNGKYYEFMLEIDITGGMARLWDSLGRMVPIDSTQYGELAKAINRMIALQAKYDEFVATADTMGVVIEPTTPKPAGPNLLAIGSTFLCTPSFMKKYYGK